MDVGAIRLNSESRIYQPHSPDFSVSEHEPEPERFPQPVISHNQKNQMKPVSFGAFRVNSESMISPSVSVPSSPWQITTISTTTATTTTKLPTKPSESSLTVGDLYAVIRKHKYITAITIVIVILLCLILSQIRIEDRPIGKPPDGKNGYDHTHESAWYDVEHLGTVEFVCGEVVDNDDISESECIEHCYWYPDGGIVSYYIEDLNLCFCESFETTHERRHDGNDMNMTDIDDCITINETVEQYQVHAKGVAGRPYNIDSKECDLRADIVRLQCDEYQFYGQEDTEWKGFVMNHRQNVSNEVVDMWIERSFSEHASIGTFAKFSVELMSLGAPLWFLERASIAALQEIEHARISFDILNMYLMHNYEENECVEYSAFPTHSVIIDGDHNRIALDTAIGGCFGETLSAMTYEQYLNGDLKETDIDDVVTHKLNGIPKEEVQHAALAWTTVKWIMDHFEETEIGKREWWTRELKIKEILSDDDIEKAVYQRVIPKIVDRLFDGDSGVDYKVFFMETKRELTQFMQTKKCTF